MGRGQRFLVVLCAPLALAAAPSHLIEEPEWGLAIVFPADRKLCEGLSGEHVHGHYITLDGAQCDRSSEAGETSMGVYSTYNALFATLEEDFRSQCDAIHGKRIRSERMGLPPHQLACLGSQQGTQVLHVQRATGRTALDDPDIEARGKPVIFHYFTLSAPKDRMNGYLPAFRKFLSEVRSIPIR